NAFRQFGLFVLRDFFSATDRDRLTTVWDEFYHRALEQQRLVGAHGGSNQDLCEPPPQEIAELYRHPRLVELLQRVYGEDIVFCQQRVLIKDAHFGGGIFAHQDFSYYLGGMEKTGLFIPLTACGRDNGGLHFMLESHKLGYLGDRGYIPADRLVDGTVPGLRTVCPTVRPGDVVLMHICLLHYSNDQQVSAPRVYVNPYYQPATDGSYDNLI